jgi:hypothetical protein
MHFEVPLSGSEGIAGNDNLRKLTSAVTGGLPVDPALNAMRVFNIGGGGDITDATKAAADSASPASVKATANALEATTKSSTSSEDSGRGGLLSWMGRQASGVGNWFSSLFGGGKSDGASGDSGSSGGGFMSKIGKLLGNFPGGILNSLFGDKFYENGGLIGSLFGGGGGGGLPDLSGGAMTTDMYHAGGLVGADDIMRRSVSPLAFLGAPRFHAGLRNDEFAAVLQRGERVLTANQNMRLEGILSSALPRAGGAGAAAMSRAMNGMRAANQNGRGGDVNNNGHTIHVNVGGPMSGDEARRTGYQIANSLAGRLQSTSRRSMTR